MIVIRGDISVDERGSVRFVNSFEFKDVKRFYQVENHEKGYIRAWHGHKVAETYIYVVKGSAWVGVINMDNKSSIMHVLSDKLPTVLWVPPGSWNGFKTLEEGTIVMFFSTLSLEEVRADDIREDYNTFPLFTIKPR
jgi:dTDP-4-dehydrorhamnose 3,5-epimerase